MKAKTYDTPYETIIKGWKALVKEMGVVGATKFWMYMSAGQGDSVKEIKAILEDKGFKEIHEEIQKYKKQKNKFLP